MNMSSFPAESLARPTRGEQVLSAGALLGAAVLGLTFSVGRGFLGVAEAAPTIPAGAMLTVALAVACALFRTGWLPGRWLGWILLLATAAGSIGFVLRSLLAPSSPWDPEQALALLGSDRPWLRLSPPLAMALLITAGLVALSAIVRVQHGRWRRLGLLLSLAMGALCIATVISRAANFPMFALEDPLASSWGAVALGLVHTALAVGFGLWPETTAIVLGQPPPDSGRQPERRGGGWLLLAVAALLSVVLAATFFFLRSLVEARQEELQHDLSDLLELKVAQIEEWRRERLGDARVMLRVPRMAESIAALGRNPRSAPADFSLGEFLTEIQRTYGYHSVSVLDARGVPVWSSSPEALNVTLPSSALRARLPQAGEAILDDLQLGPGGEVWLDVLAPVRAPGGQEVVGAVFLRVDARRHVLSLVDQTLTRWESGELLLIRREGDQVLFLSQLRFQPDAALKLRLPFATPDLLAAQALQGRLATLGAGHDYRNVRVLGMAKRVPGSPWMVLAKIDQAEAYAPVRADAWSIGIAFTGVLFCSGMVARGFWRRQQLEHVRQRGVAEQARREAELALRQREQLISTVFDQALDSIVLYDLKDNRFTEFNQAAHRNLGYTKEEFARLTIRDIDVGLTPEQVASAIHAFSSPVGGFVDTRHRRKDGTTLEVRLGARKITIGDRDYLVTMWSDITERRKMEEAVRASEERHRALFENMDLGVVYQDATGTIIAANSAASTILGLSLDQLQGRTSIDPEWRALREDGSAFPGEEHPAPVALRTGTRINGVVMGVRSGSRPETRWLLVDAVPEFRPGESNPYRVFAIFNDITARRRAEAEIRQLSTAVEQSPVAVIITDLSGRIEYVNERFTELSGFTAAEAIGQNSRVLKSGRTPAANFNRLWQTILAGGVWRGELVNRKKNGELFIAHALITPVRDAAGHATHYLALEEDITERKRAEAELLETAAGLKLLHDVAVALEMSELSPAVLGAAVAAELPGLTGAPADSQAVVEIDGHRQVGGAAGERLEETTTAISINGRPARSPWAMYGDPPAVWRLRLVPARRGWWKALPGPSGWASVAARPMRRSSASTRISK